MYIHICVYVYECVFTHPFCLNRMWYKVNFSAEFNKFEVSFSSPRLVAKPRLKSQSDLLFTHNRKENIWMHVFPLGIYAMGNANSLVQDLNSGRRVDFLGRKPLHHEHLLKTNYI